MIETVIAGLFTIIGAFGGAHISKYGWPFSRDRRKRIIKGSGKGKDFELAAHLEDFSDLDSFSYVFSNVVLTTDNRKATLSADMITTDEDQNQSRGIIKGTGIYQDGVAYLSYQGNYPAEHIEWSGLLAIRLPAAGSCKGYWITEHTSEKGKFAFGWVEFGR